MTEYGGFLNSSDAKTWRYQDIDFARMLSLLTGGQGYIVGYGDELEVALGDEATVLEEDSTSEVLIKTGAAWIGEPSGWWYINYEQKSLDIPLIETSGTNRIDRIVLRLNRDSEVLSISLDIKQGIAGSSPEAPALTQDMDDAKIYEISLAQVYVTGDSTTLSISDERDSEFCGQLYLAGILQSNYPLMISSNISETASFTLSSNHINAFVKCNNAAGLTVTVPTNATVAFPECTDITLWQEGTGEIIIQPASGVIIYADGYAHDATDETFNSVGLYTALTLRKIDTDSWVAIGALSTNEA